MCNISKKGTKCLKKGPKRDHFFKKVPKRDFSRKKGPNWKHWLCTQCPTIYLHTRFGKFGNGAPKSHLNFPKMRTSAQFHISIFFEAHLTLFLKMIIPRYD